MPDKDNPILAAMAARRSVRKFTGQPVERQDVLAILEAGRWAPSGKNNQPWRFLVVMAGDPRQEVLAGCTRYGPIVRGGAALICVFLDRQTMYHEMKDHQGAGACMQNMLLAVHALGLGAVWLGEIINQAPQVLDALGLDPQLLELQAVLVVGHPAHPGAASRRELSELLLEPLS